MALISPSSAKKQSKFGIIFISIQLNNTLVACSAQSDFTTASILFNLIQKARSQVASRALPSTLKA
jgi:hypothetical protein